MPSSSQDRLILALLRHGWCKELIIYLLSGSPEPESLLRLRVTCLDLQIAMEDQVSTILTHVGEALSHIDSIAETLDHIEAIAKSSDLIDVRTCDQVDPQN